MKARVFITGAAGFLAGHLYERLGKCRWVDSILGVDRTATSAHWIRKADLTDTAVLARVLHRYRPDVVFHLSSSPPHAPLEELLAVNVVGTRRLIEILARQQKPPVVLVAGSAAEYGDVRRDEIPVKEDTPLRPLNYYGISKAAQTMLCLAEMRRLRIPVIICRPFNIVGPGMPRHLAFGNFAYQVAKAEFGQGKAQLRVGKLAGKRDFIDVRDIAEALCLLTRAGKAGEIYNVCSGILHSVHEGLDIFLQCSSANIRVVKDRSRGSHFEPPDYSGDNSKIARETGWHPTIPFEQSMADILESARSGTAG